jgi:large-conductance mechanosensitive channel
MSVSIITILASFGIIGSAIGYTVGIATYNIVNTFMITIGIPLLSKLISRNITKYVITISGVKLHIGTMINSLINFILILLFIIFGLKIIFKNVVSQIITEQTSQNNKIIKLLEQIVNWTIPLQY